MGNMQASDSVTFNAPGTWTTPARLLTVTVNGKGGAGNAGGTGTGGPGAPGNAGM